MAINLSAIKKIANNIDALTTAPTGTSRLNFSNYLYATKFFGDNIPTPSNLTLGRYGFNGGAAFNYAGGGGCAYSSSGQGASGLVIIEY